MSAGIIFTVFEGLIFAMNPLLPCLRLPIVGLAILALAGCASTPPVSLPTLATDLPDPARASANHTPGAAPAHDLIGVVADQIVRAPFAAENASPMLVLPLRNTTGRPLDLAGLSAALGQALSATGRFTLVQPTSPSAAAPMVYREQRLLNARSSGARYLVQGVLELDEMPRANADTIVLRAEVTDLSTSLVVWMVRQPGQLPVIAPTAKP